MRKTSFAFVFTTILFLSFIEAQKIKYHERKKIFRDNKSSKNAESTSYLVEESHNKTSFKQGKFVWKRMQIYNILN